MHNPRQFFGDVTIIGSTGPMKIGRLTKPHMEIRRATPEVDGKTKGDLERIALAKQKRSRKFIEKAARHGGPGVVNLE